MDDRVVPIEMVSGPGRYHSKGTILNWDPPHLFEYRVERGAGAGDAGSESMRFSDTS